MLLQHGLVVHLIDVIAGEDDDITRIVTFDDVDVLIHGVRGAEIPFVLGDALAAGSISKLSLRSGRKKFQPRCRWRIRLCALYCVATAMRRMPEFTRWTSAKSMMRSLPPK